MIKAKKVGVKFYGQVEDLTKDRYVRTTGDHEVFNCPYCFDLVGKDDTGGKLYYSILRRVGFCQRCNVIIIDDSLRDKDSLQRLFEYQQSTVNELVLYESTQVMNIKWAKLLKENEEVASYLSGRGIHPLVSETYNVLSTNLPTKGVVFINTYLKEGYVDYYQIRFLEGDKRHSSASNIKKPLSWIEKAKDKIILCEGFTSGLSAYQESFSRLGFYPVITQGKYLSTLQLTQFQKWSNKQKNPEVLICLDGGKTFEFALRMAKDISEKMKSGNIYLVNLPWEKDPNDLLNNGLFDHLKRGLNELKYNPLLSGYLRKKIYEK